MKKATAKKEDGREQSRRFIEAAREAGASEDEREFDKALKRVAKPKPKEQKPRP